MVDEIKIEQAPTTFDIREIIRQKLEQDHSSFEKKSKVIKAITIGVDSTNSPAVAGRDKYVWVRERSPGGNAIPVLNPDKIALVVNLPVLVMYDPREPFQWQIWGIDWEAILNLSDYTGQSFGVGSHGTNHDWPDYSAGYDPISVYPRALVPLRTYPGSSGLQVSVYSHRYAYEGEVVKYSGEVDALDLASYQPSIGYARLVVIYLDKKTKTLGTVAGDLLPDGAILPLYPSLPGEAIISAAVRIDGDQTTITDEDITDLRMVLMDTEISGILKSLAFTESEIDYTLSNHELRLDGLGTELASEIQDLDDSMRHQLALIESELDFALTMTVV